MQEIANVIRVVPPMAPSEIEKVSLTFNLTLELEAFWLTVTSLTFRFGKNL